jgi:hypothetical protein
MTTEMNFEQWVKDHDKENARFVFESKAKTLEEMECVLEKMQEKDEDYRETLGLLLWVIDVVEERKKDLQKSKEWLEEILEFENSEICKMIMDFCENNTIEKLNAIQDYIEKDNQFGIVIKGNQEEIARNRKGELAYGFNINNHFHVDKIYKYYNFDNCDIEDDIQQHKRCVENAKKLYEDSVKTLEDYCKQFEIEKELLDYIMQTYKHDGDEYYEWKRDYDDHPYYTAKYMLYGESWCNEVE